MGYRSKRFCLSRRDRKVRVEYTSRVLDNGPSPLFQVVAADEPDQPMESDTASGAWCAVLTRINELKEKKRSKVTISGPEMYGLADPLVKTLIEELPGADECTKYRRTNRKEDSPTKAAAVAGGKVKLAGAAAPAGAGAAGENEEGGQDDDEDVDDEEDDDEATDDEATDDGSVDE